MRVAINMHAWGPLLIVPYNYDRRTNNLKLRKNDPKAFDFMHSIKQESQIESSYQFGNGVSTIGYTANGEASDWMLHELGIYAMSPELGTNNSRSSEYFFIRSKKALKETLDLNYPWIQFTI